MARTATSCLGFSASSGRFLHLTAPRWMVVLVALTCVRSNPLHRCEKLLKPMGVEDHSGIFGKWYLLLTASDSWRFLGSTIPVKSGWIDVKPTDDPKVLSLHWGEWIQGTCSYGITKLTVTDNPNSYFKFTTYLKKREGYYLTPCPDCLLWIDTASEGGETGKNLDMYRRTPKLEYLHLNIFQRHAACLNFPPKYTSYDGVTEVCSDNKDLDLCDDLLKPPGWQDLTPIHGKWISVVGASDQSRSQVSLEAMKSCWVEVSPSPHGNDLTLHWAKRIDGVCNYRSAPLVNDEQDSNRASFKYGSGSHPHNGTFFQPCPDCLLWIETSTVLDVTTRLMFLFRRTAKLDAFHLEIFRNHATCRNFPQTYNSYDGVTELCP